MSKNGNGFCGVLLGFPDPVAMVRVIPTPWGFSGSTAGEAFLSFDLDLDLALPLVAAFGKGLTNCSIFTVSGSWMCTLALVLIIGARSIPGSTDAVRSMTGTDISASSSGLLVGLLVLDVFLALDVGLGGGGGYVELDEAGSSAPC